MHGQLRYTRAVLVPTYVRFAALVAAGACGRSHAQPDAVDDRRDGAVVDARATSDGAPHDAATDAAAVDAFPAVLDVHIQCRNDCVLVAQPPSITVTAGTSFQVNWINTGDTICDVNK